MNPSLKTSPALTEHGPSSKAFWILMAVLLLVDVTKHSCTFFLGPPVLENDASEYWERGGRVSRGDVWQVEGAVNYRGPLYPYLIGVCRWLFEDNGMIALSAMQHGLHIASGWIVAAMCWECFRNRWAVLLGYALCVGCVTSTWFANVVLTEVMFQFVLTSFFWMMTKYHVRPTATYASLMGITLGLATLTRPIPKLLWLPMLIMIGAHRSNRLTNHTLSWRAVSWQGIVFFASLSLVLIPWSIRNRVYFENASVAKVPPINKWVVCFHPKSAPGLSIPDSSSGEKLREYLPTIDQDFELRHDGYEVIRRLQKAGLSAVEIDQLVTSVCLDAIESNPTAFFWSMFKRFGNFWRCTVSPYPYYSSYPEAPSSGALGEQRSWRIDSLARGYERILEHSLFTNLQFTELYSLLCLISVMFMILHLDTRIFGLSILVILLYFSSITAALEIENYRYRMVLEPLLSFTLVAGVFRGSN
jgi:hypothetical protein